MSLTAGTELEKIRAQQVLTAGAIPGLHVMRDTLARLHQCVLDGESPELVRDWVHTQLKHLKEDGCEVVARGDNPARRGRPTVVYRTWALALAALGPRRSGSGSGSSTTKKLPQVLWVPCPGIRGVTPEAMQKQAVLTEDQRLTQSMVNHLGVVWRYRGRVGSLLHTVGAGQSVLRQNGRYLDTQTAAGDAEARRETEFLEHQMQVGAYADSHDLPALRKKKQQLERERARKAVRTNDPQRYIRQDRIRTEEVSGDSFMRSTADAVSKAVLRMLMNLPVYAVPFGRDPATSACVYHALFAATVAAGTYNLFEYQETRNLTGEPALQPTESMNAGGVRLGTPMQTTTYKASQNLFNRLLQRNEEGLHFLNAAIPPVTPQGRPTPGGRAARYRTELYFLLRDIAEGGCRDMDELEATATRAYYLLPFVCTGLEKGVEDCQRQYLPLVSDAHNWAEGWKGTGLSSEQLEEKDCRTDREWCSDPRATEEYKHRQYRLQNLGFLPGDGSSAAPLPTRTTEPRPELCRIRAMLPFSIAQQRSPAMATLLLGLLNLETPGRVVAYGYRNLHRALATSAIEHPILASTLNDLSLEAQHRVLGFAMEVVRDTGVLASVNIEARRDEVLVGSWVPLPQTATPAAQHLMGGFILQPDAAIMFTALDSLLAAARRGRAWTSALGCLKSGRPGAMDVVTELTDRPYTIQECYGDRRLPLKGRGLTRTLLYAVGYGEKEVFVPKSYELPRALEVEPQYARKRLSRRPAKYARDKKDHETARALKGFWVAQDALQKLLQRPRRCLRIAEVGGTETPAAFMRAPNFMQQEIQAEEQRKRMRQLLRQKDTNQELLADMMAAEKAAEREREVQQQAQRQTRMVHQVQLRETGGEEGKEGKGGGEEEGKRDAVEETAPVYTWVGQLLPILVSQPLHSDVLLSCQSGSAVLGPAFCEARQALYTRVRQMDDICMETGPTQRQNVALSDAVAQAGFRCTSLAELRMWWLAHYEHAYEPAEGAPTAVLTLREVTADLQLACAKRGWEVLTMLMFLLRIEVGALFSVQGTKGRWRRVWTAADPLPLQSPTVFQRAQDTLYVPVCRRPVITTVCVLLRSNTSWADFLQFIPKHQRVRNKPLAAGSRVATQLFEMHTATTADARPTAPRRRRPPAKRKRPDTAPASASASASATTSSPVSTTQSKRASLELRQPLLQQLLRSCTCADVHIVGKAGGLQFSDSFDVERWYRARQKLCVAGVDLGKCVGVQDELYMRQSSGRQAFTGHLENYSPKRVSMSLVRLVFILYRGAAVAHLLENWHKQKHKRLTLKCVLCACDKDSRVCINPTHLVPAAFSHLFAGDMPLPTSAFVERVRLCVG